MYNFFVEFVNFLPLKINSFVSFVLFSSEKTQSDESAVDEPKYLNCDLET